MTPTLGIVGAGKVGQTLARLLFARGYTIGAVYSPNHAVMLAQVVGARVTKSPVEVFEYAELILLAVPDDAIERVAGQMAVCDLAGYAVVHTSGAHDVNSLSAVAACGAMTGSLHPAFPFADVATAVQQLPGAAFAIEAADAVLQAWLVALVQALDGQVLHVPPGQKALYHAALVLTSNYTVTLYAVAQRLLLHMGADSAATDQALRMLLRATVDNLHAVGVPDALTGPLLRGDAGTVAAHLAVLDQNDPALALLYQQLGVLTLPLVAARGGATQELWDVLKRGADNATDNT